MSLWMVSAQISSLKHDCFCNHCDTSDFRDEIQELSDKLKDNQHSHIAQKDVERPCLL